MGVALASYHPEDLLQGEEPSLAAAGVVFASPDIVWLCKLEGELSGKSEGMVASHFRLEGEALLTCFSLLGGGVVSKKVDISIASLGAGLGYSEVKGMRIVAHGMGFDDVEELSKHYRLFTSAPVDFIGAGVEPSVGFYVVDQGQGFSVQLQGRDVVKIGAHIQGSVMRVQSQNGSE